MEPGSYNSAAIILLSDGRRTTGIDQHNDQLRFGWELTGADGTVLVTGIDVAQVAVDGRLSQVAGFWGDLPTA